MSAEWAAVPRPVPGHLTVYVLGPGYGESQVLVFPDDRCVVVDACRLQGRSGTLELLRHIGRTRVDLLVVTHGDLDHSLASQARFCAITSDSAGALGRVTSAGWSVVRDSPLGGLPLVVLDIEPSTSAEVRVGAPGAILKSPLASPGVVEVTG